MLLPVLALACGPTRSTSVIIDAAAELKAAKTAQSAAAAPYEYAAAESYLHKAREEQSYSDFEVAERLAKKARDCARLARSRSEAQTRSDLGASARSVTSDAVCRAGPMQKQVPLHELEPADTIDIRTHSVEPSEPEDRPTPKDETDNEGAEE